MTGFSTLNYLKLLKFNIVGILKLQGNESLTISEEGL